MANNVILASEGQTPFEDHVRFLCKHRGNASTCAVRLLFFGLAYSAALLFNATPSLQCMMDGPPGELLAETERRCFNNVLRSFVTGVFLVFLFKSERLMLGLGLFSMRDLITLDLPPMVRSCE